MINRSAYYPFVSPQVLGGVPAGAASGWHRWLSGKLGISPWAPEELASQKLAQVFTQAHALALNLPPAAVPTLASLQGIQPAYKAAVLGLPPAWATSHNIDRVLFRRVVQETLPIQLQVRTPEDVAFYRHFIQSAVGLAQAKR